MSYADVTLAPDDIEWERTNVWAAANDRHEFENFITQRGLEEAIEQFHKAHRMIANKLIRAGVTSGDEFEDAPKWIFAARRFKDARKKATHRYRAQHGIEQTFEFQRSLNLKYERAKHDRA